MRPAPFHQARIAAELAQLEKGVEFGCRIAARALQKGQQIADCRQRRLLPETVRRHLCPQDCGSLSDAGPSGSPRQGPRLALGVNRHMVQIGLGHRDPIQLGRVALGIDLDMHAHAGGADARDVGVGATRRVRVIIEWLFRTDDIHSSDDVCRGRFCDNGCDPHAPSVSGKPAAFFPTAGDARRMRLINTA